MDKEIFYQLTDETVGRLKIIYNILDCDVVEGCDVIMYSLPYDPNTSRLSDCEYLKKRVLESLSDISDTIKSEIVDDLPKQSSVDATGDIYFFKDELRGIINFAHMLSNENNELMDLIIDFQCDNSETSKEEFVEYMRDSITESLCLAESLLEQLGNVLFRQLGGVIKYD